MSAQESKIGRRVMVVGVTGSGKTTLAGRLARLLDCPHIELDAVHWGPNWTGLERELFRERVAALVAADRWVTDGNYSAVRDLVLARAETLVWLDYPLPVALWRLLRRTAGRVFRRTELWNGNRERLCVQLSRDSLILWLFKSYSRHRRSYGALRSDPACAHLQIVHLRSPREAARWLRSLGWRETGLGRS